MKYRVLPFPILSIACVVFAYGLLGWRLAAIPALWVISSWFGTVVVIIALTWWGNYLGRLVQVGARSLLLIFFLSIGFTLAIAYAETFALGLILMLTIFWGRLEMQIRGMSRISSLCILSVVVGCALATGWFLGQSAFVQGLLQRPALWIQGR